MIMFDNFIEKVKSRLMLPLPGEDVQFEMSPVGRKKINEYPLEQYNPQKSAVLILLFPDKKLTKTVLIQRPLYQGVHSGQIAFPGGKFDVNDIDLKHTALRETHEEVGILPEKINIIGNLSDIYISPSNFLVTPFIGYTEFNPRFIINKSEVDKLITYDVAALNNPNIKSKKLIKLSMGFEINAPYYNIEGATVWGATAMMISELNKVIEETK